MSDLGQRIVVGGVLNTTKLALRGWTDLERALCGQSRATKRMIAQIDKRLVAIESGPANTAGRRGLTLSQLMGKNEYEQADKENYGRLAFTLSQLLTMGDSTDRAHIDRFLIERLLSPHLSEIKRQAQESAHRAQVDRPALEVWADCGWRGRIHLADTLPGSDIKALCGHKIDSDQARPFGEIPDMRRCLTCVEAHPQLPTDIGLDVSVAYEWLFTSLLQWWQGLRGYLNHAGVTRLDEYTIWPVFRVSAGHQDCFPVYELLNSCEALVAQASAVSVLEHLRQQGDRPLHLMAFLEGSTALERLQEKNRVYAQSGHLLVEGLNQDEFIKSHDEGFSAVERALAPLPPQNTPPSDRRERLLAHYLSV